MTTQLRCRIHQLGQASIGREPTYHPTFRLRGPFSLPTSFTLCGVLLSVAGVLTYEYRKEALYGTGVWLV